MSYIFILFTIYIRKVEYLEYVHNIQVEKVHEKRKNHFYNMIIPTNIVGEVIG